MPHTLAPQSNPTFVGVETLPFKVTDAAEQDNVWLDPALRPVGAVVFVVITT